MSSLHRDEPLKGISLMLLAMVIFSAMDGMAKLMTADYDPIQVVWGRFLAQAVAMLPFVWMRLQRHGGLRATRPTLQLLRGVLMLSTTVLFTVGISVLPLATATAIGFLSPLFVTALAVPLLGDKVGWRRWTALGVGFAGVLLVVRPGTAAFHPIMLCIIGSCLAWALGFICVRKMGSADGPIITLIYSVFVGFLLSNVMVPFVWVTPDLEGWLMFFALGIVNLLGQYLFVKAIAYGEPAVLAPFTYSQIVWTTLIGLFVFGNMPDGWTFLGAGIVSASGLYVWHRERVRRREALARAAAA